MANQKVAFFVVLPAVGSHFLACVPDCGLWTHDPMIPTVAFLSRSRTAHLCASKRGYEPRLLSIRGADLSFATQGSDREPFDEAHQNIDKRRKTIGNFAFFTQQQQKEHTNLKKKLEQS